MGFEPTTICLEGRDSTGLSYPRVEAMRFRPWAVSPLEPSARAYTPRQRLLIDYSAGVWWHPRYPLGHFRMTSCMSSLGDRQLAAPT